MTAVELRRLKWYCRRGMKELDVLLEAYLEKDYPKASPSEQKSFSELLECGDMQLMAWLLRGDKPEYPELESIVTSVCTCYQREIKKKVKGEG